VPKTYRVTVRGRPEEALRRLREGVELDDGPTRPTEVRLVRGGGGGVLGGGVRGGGDRQGRRGGGAGGAQGPGPGAGGGRGRRALKPGECRRLSDDEVARLLSSRGYDS